MAGFRAEMPDQAAANVACITIGPNAERLPTPMRVASTPTRAPANRSRSKEQSADASDHVKSSEAEIGKPAR